MLKNKVQIYPPKAGLTTQVNIFPITNILKGSGTIYGQSKFFSFIHQAAFDTLSQTCAFWYSPVGGIILRNITFQYEVVTELNSNAKLDVNSSGSFITDIPIINTVGVHNLSLQNIDYQLAFGDNVSLFFKMGTGTYKVFSITAIFSFV